MNALRSLQSRLLTGVIGGIALLLVLFSLGVYAMVRRSLLAEFDGSLVATARTLAASVEEDEGRIALEIKVEQLTEFQQGKRPAYFELFLNGGPAVMRSPSLGRNDLPQFTGTYDAPAIRRLVLPGGKPGRAVGIKFVPAGEVDKGDKDKGDKGKGARQGNMQQSEEVVLVVARNTIDLLANLRLLRWVLAGAGTAVMAMATLVAAAVVRRGVRPLKALADRIVSIKEDKLDDRVSVDQMPSEMAPVAEKLNDLLARLNAAFKRERAFTADVAHELRTPLAGVLSTMEVTLRRTREPAEYRQVLSDCLEIAGRMQSMIERLLALARLEAGQAAFDPERINLCRLVDSCWENLADKGRLRRAIFENALPSDLSCVSGRDILLMALQNLLENAAKYVDEGGRIRVTGRASPDSVEIAICNTGAQLTPDQIPQVFDRFWRGDASRTNTGIHCGLGLTLVQRCITELGGTVSADVDDSRVFTVTVVLPAEVRRNPASS